MSATTREKLQTTALVIAFPLLMAAAYAIREYKRVYVPRRKRLADLAQAEIETGCDVGGREMWGDPW